MSKDKELFFTQKANTQQDLALASLAFKHSLLALGYLPIGEMSETLTRQIAKEIADSERAKSADDIGYLMYRDAMHEVMLDYQKYRRARRPENCGFIEAQGVTLFDFDD